jgi:hypothetical protein
MPEYKTKTIRSWKLHEENTLAEVVGSQLMHYVDRGYEISSLKKNYKDKGTEVEISIIRGHKE